LGLSEEYDTIINDCKESIVKTKKEIDLFVTQDKEVYMFLEKLKESWRELL